MPLLNLALIGAFFAVNGSLRAHHALVLATITILAITVWQWKQLRRREMLTLVRDPTKADPRRWLRLLCR